MQTPPTPPSPPAAPQAPTGAIVGVGANGGAQITEIGTLSYQALRARGSELSRQLESATSRRDGLARDLRRASNPAMQDGLRSQMSELNVRIVDLEKAIAVNGQLLVTARGRENSAGSTTESPSPIPNVTWMPSSGEITAITIVFTLFVMFPISLSISRLFWKRATRMATAPSGPTQESALRLERVEQAVDAIAVEVERISEGQRFVTQLMTQQPALGEGAQQPIRVASAEPVMADWQRK